MANLSNINNKFIVTDSGHALLGTTSTAYSGTLLHIGNTSDSQNGIQIQTSTSGYGYVLFGDGGGAQAYRGQISYNHGSDKLDLVTGGSTRVSIAGTLMTFPTLTELRGDIGSNKFAVCNMGNASSQMMVSSRGFLTFNVSNTGSGLDATERMRIDSGGNVGIGTDSPSTKLEVKMNDTANNRLGFTGDGSTTGAAMWTNWQTGNSYLDFRLGGITSTYTKMRITSDGKVGIGTTSPAEKLEVSGSVKIGNLKIQNADGGRIGFNRNTATGAIYDSNYAAFQINGAYSGADYLEIQNYASTGGFLGSAVLKNGNFGIGTTSPSYKLEVNGGTTLVGGAFYVSSDQSISTNFAYTFRDGVGINNPNSISATPNAGYTMCVGRSNNGAGVSGSLSAVGTIKATAFTVNIDTTAGIGGSNGDVNASETGPGYINLSRDDTAAAQQIRFEKNGALHSYIETTTSGLNIGDTNVGIGTASPGGNLEIKTLSGGAGVNTLRLNTNFANGNTVDINPFITGANNGGMEIKLAGSQKLVMLPSGNVGIGVTSPNTKLDVSGTTGTRNRNTQGSSVYETSLYFVAAGNATTNVSINTTTAFPPMVSGGFILVEVSASGYGSSGSNGLVFSYISGGYGGHYGGQGQPYHPVEIIANTMQAGSCTFYYPNSTTVGIAVTTTNSGGLNGVMRVKVTTTY